MALIDETALFHRGVYDPVKAREYYLRTRQLKGRQSGGRPQGAGQVRASPVKPGTPGSSARKEQIEAQKAALQKRLERLRDVLAELVDAAKIRSGVEDKSDPSDKTSGDPKETAARNEVQKKDTPLTTAQKRKKADTARKEYQKKYGTSDSQEVKQLKSQIANIRTMIQKAIADAQQKSSQSKTQTASKGR